jgi:hypothetical protein
MELDTIDLRKGVVVSTTMSYEEVKAFATRQLNPKKDESASCVNCRHNLQGSEASRGNEVLCPDKDDGNYSGNTQPCHLHQFKR